MDARGRGGSRGGNIQRGGMAGPPAQEELAKLKEELAKLDPEIQELIGAERARACRDGEGEDGPRVRMPRTTSKPCGARLCTMRHHAATKKSPQRPSATLSSSGRCWPS